MGPISIGIVLFAFLLLANIQNEAVFGIAGLFLSRTLGVNAYHVPMYLVFFEKNPYTYFSHINFVNAFTHSYPYNGVLVKWLQETGVILTLSFG